MATLIEPNNVSQGDLDDFLMSPGYKGIVQGAYTFNVVSGVSTRAIFTPTRALAPSIQYYVNIYEPLDESGNTVSGFVTWGFQTGTGSIETLPSTISTSILASSPQSQGFALINSPLRVVRTTPVDHAIEQSTDLEEITIEFNKLLDPNSVTDGAISVKTEVATNHPTANAQAAGELYKFFQVNGKFLRIKI